MTDRRRYWAWAAGAGAAAGLLRLASLNLFLDRDEGEYATLAWLWRSGAGVPYRDYLEQKPPLSVGMNALAQALSSDGVFGLRCLSWIWGVATVVALYALVEAMARRGRMGWRLQRDIRLRTALAGCGAFVAAALLSDARTQSLAANTETWQTLPLLGALALLFLPEPRDLKPRNYVGAGVLIGVAALFKQTAGFAVFLLPLACQERKGRLLPSVAWTVLGALAPWAGAWEIFHLNGAGLDFLQCLLVYDRAYALQSWVGAAGRAVGLGMYLAPLLAPLGWLAFLGWRALGRDRGSRAWLGAWLGVGFCGAAAAGRYYPHYVIPLLAPLALLGVLGVAGLKTAAPGWSKRRAPRALRWVLAAAFALSYLLIDGPLWTAPSGRERTWTVYHVRSFVQAPLAAERLRQRCPEEEKLFVWGNEAELFYLAQRRPATRFLFVYPFTGEAPVWPGGEDELLNGLMGPGTGAAAVSQPLDPSDPLQREVTAGLRAQYDADSSIHAFILGVRRK
jgi:4-amino-4-deoxy-L-arabinose transferase-like glycosyltransferase